MVYGVPRYWKKEIDSLGTVFFLETKQPLLRCARTNRR
jgi:hypothetical protein